MEESGSNQVRRRGHRTPTGHRQNELSESETRRREHDRHRRRRDALRAQLAQHVPLSSPQRPAEPPAEQPLPFLYAPESPEEQPLPFSDARESPLEQSLVAPAAYPRNADAIRLENIFRAANSTLSMEEFARDQELQTYIRWGSQLADSFNFNAIVQNIRNTLSQVNPNENATSSVEHIRDPTIPPEIYRLLQKPTHNMATTPASQFIEAFRLWEVSQYFCC